MRKPRLFVKGRLEGASRLMLSSVSGVGCEIVFVMHGFTGHTSDAVSAHQ
jgi:hypothetical protein